MQLGCFMNCMVCCVFVCRTMHDKDVRVKGGLTRFQFFLIALTCSYCYYVMPGYLFNMLTSLSWVCWAWPNSVTAQQLGSGLYGLGIGAIALDWSSVSSFLGSPMGTPFFAVLNVFLGFALITYVLTPAFYWGNVYNARTFPIFSSDFFTSTGQTYNVSAVITENFQLDEPAYNAYGRLHISTFFAVTYGVGFAALAATISHVALFHGR